MYLYFGFTVSPEFDAKMHKYLEANPNGKHGKHVYTMEEYGITEEQIRASFAAYCERFSIQL